MDLDELAAALVVAAGARGLTVAVAESCTGGLLGHSITNVPGSSQVFLGGVIAYADAVKEKALGVAAADLAAHGAVSAPVALAMARGARLALGADLALGTTGVAGPGGGTAAKPVGLVFLAVSGPWGDHCRRFQAGSARLANKHAFAREALSLLLEYLRANGDLERSQPEA
ncbi:MAG: CinA family protein [Chloroflexota bacterium]